MTALTETTSGRLIPRQQPRAEPCDVRFRGDPRGGIIAACVPCQWHVHLADHHSAADFTRLEAQHQGKET